MSDHVELLLYDFLLVTRRECCDAKAQKKYSTDLQRNYGSPIWIQLCHLAGHHTQPPHNKTWFQSKRIFERQMLEWWAHSNGTTVDKLSKEQRDEWEARKNRKFLMKYRVIEILWAKFNEFRLNPNHQRRVKFDRISPHLLRFFTENTQIGQDSRNRISFKEILSLYPNVKTITFVNRHLQDGHNVSCLNMTLLRSLLNLILEKENDDAWQLEKVMFAYYDFEGDIFEANDRIYTEVAQKEERYFVENILRDQKGADNMNHPQRKALGKAGWVLKHHVIQGGYKVRIEKK